MSSAVFYLSYLYFIAVPALIWAIVARPAIAGWRAPRIVSIGVLIILSVLAYARFIEPRLLQVHEHNIAMEGCFAETGAVRLGVFSDIHLGIFSHAIPAERIAQRIRALDVDASVIAGDFTYHLKKDRFEAAFGPLGQSGHPVYFVMGNHDVGMPGPMIHDELGRALDTIGLVNIEDRAVRQRFARGRLELVGLSEFWLGKQELGQLSRNPLGTPRLPRILLVHNPDTVLALPPAAEFDLMIAGHTHGGQINLGPATCWLAKMACYVTRQGLARVAQGQWRDDYPYNKAFRPNGAPLMRSVFVTTGTGMVGLPFRFAMPPRIDVLNLYFQGCATSTTTGEAP